MSLAPAADRAYLAAFLDLRGKPGVVVGGGRAAAGRVDALLRSGVRVTVIAPEICERLAQLALVGAVRLERRRFAPGDLVGAELAIAATDDPAVNESVSAAARSLRIPVNVADNAKLSSFILPSVVDRPPLQIAISAAGTSQRAQPGGFVSLVGAGPGDPELLTLRALRVMQAASVVLYDHLVSPPLVDLARRDAERIYVGKRQDNHALPQAEINALMVRLAREGKRVVRLKGGDPFIFGRGGEEIEALLEHGVAFEVVPGITAAAGAASYAGIPLTHRDYAQSCVFVTGHLKDGSAQLDWEPLARPNQTVAVYMGVGGLAQICRGLVEHGMPGSTPAAVVEKATLAEQRVVEGTLLTLAQKAKTERIAPPALLIVGEVVRLRAKLGWFGANAPTQASSARAETVQDS
jgi:uroporphyrin-III C-methyltransferase